MAQGRNQDFVLRREGEPVTFGNTLLYLIAKGLISRGLEGGGGEWKLAGNFSKYDWGGAKMCVSVLILISLA
jgi:hypothetical protein